MTRRLIDTDDCPLLHLGHVTYRSGRGTAFVMCLTLELLLLDRVVDCPEPQITEVGRQALDIVGMFPLYIGFILIENICGKHMPWDDIRGLRPYTKLNGDSPSAIALDVTLVLFMRLHQQVVGAK